MVEYEVKLDTFTKWKPLWVDFDKGVIKFASETISEDPRIVRLWVDTHVRKGQVRRPLSLKPSKKMKTIWTK